VKEYTEQLYIHAAEAYENFARDGCGAATHLSQWKTQMRKDWPQVQVSDVQVTNKDRESISVGESLQISARVHLGGVDPRHVRVSVNSVRAATDGRGPLSTSPPLSTIKERRWGAAPLYSYAKFASGSYGKNV